MSAAAGPGAGRVGQISGRRSGSWDSDLHGENGPTRPAPAAGGAEPEVELEAEPVEAAQIAGERIEVVRAFARDLAEHGERLGLIGPLEAGRLWSRHVLNSALLSSLLPREATVADVGSGAGLPGLVIAAMRPDLAVTLIEPMERRTAWLEEEFARLGLTNTTVLRARAEEVRDRRFDVVTARAVGALKSLLPITAPLAVDGGELILLKGAGVDAELQNAGRVVSRLGLTDVRVEMLGLSMAALATRVLRATVPTRTAPGR